MVNSYNIAINMRFVSDEPMARWLSEAELEFDWDQGNNTKNLKHNVSRDEVESLFQNPIWFAGRIVEPLHQEIRWLLLGIDNKGRKLALIFTRRKDRLRPISCRPMRPKEKKLYDEKNI
jgi:uncharacterized protein